MKVLIEITKKVSGHYIGEQYSEKRHLAKALVALGRARYVETRTYHTRVMIAETPAVPEIAKAEVIETPEEPKTPDSAEQDEGPNAVPSAIKYAEENNIDLTAINGSGKDGKILLSDVKVFDK